MPLVAQMNTIQIQHDPIDVQAYATMTQAPAITSMNLALRIVGALPEPSRNWPPPEPPYGPPRGGWPQGLPGEGPPREGWP